MVPYTPVQHLLMHDFAEAWEAAHPEEAAAACAPGTPVPLW